MSSQVPHNRSLDADNSPRMGRLPYSSSGVDDIGRRGEPFLCEDRVGFRLNRLTPQLDRGWVRGKNSKLLIHKPSPRFVVGRRNRRQQGEAGGDRCPKCAGETTTGGFELPELV
jgi:hypothetical protein